MPWEVDPMSRKLEFVTLARSPGANVSALCRRYGISRQAGYAALRAFEAGGAEGLLPRSRRPRRSPTRTAPETEALLLALREEHPAWGARKLRARLEALGCAGLPAPSTITAILHRHGRADPAESAKRGPWTRFERAEPNELWQMDFKGHFALESGRCHPLTALDDCSRFSLVLRACADERGDTVRPALADAFRTYGLPQAILADNGSPWGSSCESPWTGLGVWLLRLGIRLLHGAPYHPQTQGKEERFHRTLKEEALRGAPPRSLADCQGRFDRWRDVYNLERPHEALGMKPPASRYAPSPRTYPETLPPVEHDEGAEVRKVCKPGWVHFRGRKWRAPKAFEGERIAFRPSPEQDGVWEMRYGPQTIGRIDLRNPEE